MTLPGTVPAAEVSQQQAMPPPDDGLRRNPPILDSLPLQGAKEIKTFDCTHE